MQSTRPMLSRFRIFAALALAVLAPAPAFVLADSHYPEDRVVARFTIEPAAVEGVRNVAELTETLRQNLFLEAASPLDFEVSMHLSGNIYQNRDQQPHLEGSGIVLSLQKGKPLKGRVGAMPFNNYTDRSDEEVWGFFEDKIRDAVQYSMNATGAFEADDNNTVWLTVTDVVDGTDDVRPEGGGLVLEMTAEMVYRDGSKLGSREPPEGYRQFLRTVQLVLAPAAPAVLAEPAPEAAPAEDTATSAQDGLTGVYGFDESGLRVEKKDGGYVMYDIRKSPPNYMPMTPGEDGVFSIDYGGMPAKISFLLDDSGRASAMNLTYVEHNSSVELPRKEGE